MSRPNRWGIVPDVLKTHVYEVCEHYAELTLRTLHYRLVQVYGYPNELGFYKFLSRWCARWRRGDPELNEKFLDMSRTPVIPTLGLSSFEAWFEKEAAWVPLRSVLKRYRVPIQVERGYGSVSMFTRAVRRAHERGVEVIAYFGDLDPSGLDIERCTKKAMVPVKLKRIALTLGQVRKYRLPPRPAKPKDRRTPKYIEKYGDQTYEIEALDPQILRRITEQKLRKLIPPEELAELELREKAARVTRELLKSVQDRLEVMVREMLARGLSAEQIRRRLGGRIRF